MASKELTPQQEKFAQAYVVYRNATEAAKAAGYSERSAYNQGHRLIHNQDVLERIENLEVELETSIDVVSELEDQYNVAKNNNHTNSALKALELLAKVRTKEDEVVHKTVDQLETDIVNCLNILGEERSLKILMKCEWFNKILELEETEDDQSLDASLESDTNQEEEEEVEKVQEEVEIEDMEKEYAENAEDFVDTKEEETE
jgi:sulfatase maturation enzyme AslB (radical SAM superfamily)